MMMSVDRTVVLGLGNILNRDEGLGVHALAALAQSLTPQNAPVEFVDGGVLGLNLLPLVEGCSRLLVLDAINAGQSPGSLIELTGEAIPHYAGVKLSQHQLTFQELVGLAIFRGKLPPYLHLLGLQPADLSLGLGVSPAVTEAMPRLLHRAEQIVRAWAEK